MAKIGVGGGGSISASGVPEGHSLFALSEIATWKAIKQSDIVDDFAISSFGPSVSVYEVGDSATTPACTASYTPSNPDTVATLTDDEGSTPKDVIGSPTAFSSDETYTKTTPNDAVQLTLTAELAGDPQDVANASIYWRPLVFWGANITGAHDEAFIEALANSALDNNRDRVFTVSAGANEYIWMAYPSSYGAATFYVGGFEGGFSLIGTVDVTNSHGVLLPYYLYRSDNHSLGSTTVTVD